MEVVILFQILFLITSLVFNDMQLDLVAQRDLVTFSGAVNKKA